MGRKLTGHGFERGSPAPRNDSRRCDAHGNFTGKQCPECGGKGKARYLAIYYINGSRRRELTDCTEAEEVEVLYRQKEEQWWRQKYMMAGLVPAQGGQVAELYERFERSRSGKSKNWRKQIATVRGLLCPVLGHLDITEITEEMWLDFKEDGLEYRESATIRSYLIVIRAFYTWACKRRIVYENVAKLVELPPAGSRQNQKLEPEEVWPFLRACHPDFFPMAAVATFAGLRRGEIINLMWPQVDLKNRFLSVEPNEIWEPKTKSSVGLVPIREKLVPILKEIPKVELENSELSPWVFPQLRLGADRGHRRSVDTTFLSERMKQAREAAGIKRQISFHDLRRTFAGLLRSSGQDGITLQRALRHANLQVTEKHYVGKEMIELRDAVDAMVVPGEDGQQELRPKLKLVK